MFRVLWKLRWFFKEQWKRYVIAVLLLLIVGILEVIPPKLVGMAIDDIHVGSLTWDGVIKYLLYLLLITVVCYGITYVWMYQLFGGAYLVERKLRSRLMGHFFKMSPAFFERNRTGDLMARATNDLKAVSVTAGFGILTLTDSTIYMITILFTMSFLISWKLTLAAILPLPIMAALMTIYGKKIHERFIAAQDSFGDLNDKVLESVAGVRVIRAYVQERADEDRFHQMTEDVFVKNMKVAKIDSLFDPTIKVLTGLSYLIGLGYGAYLVFHQTITLGDLVSFNVYLGMLIWPMFAIGELMNLMQRGSASLDRVEETLSASEDVKNPEKPVQVNQPNRLQFHEYNFQYPSSSVENLKNIHVDLKRGKTLGIVGKTGSGKTTFVKQLLREYEKGSGSFALSGVDISDQTKEQVRDWIGYVPQDHVLFSRTIRENILFGHPDAKEYDIQKAIDLASFRKDLELLPEGLETLVGEKGVALSGGQKQRISIARALIKNPEILILDDSLSAVDAKTETRIIENIQRERKGKTTIITTHRLSGVEHADWILVLDDGAILQEGTHETLIREEGWYLEQFQRQQLEASDSQEVLR
ncbi:ABC transporter transmembrane domain-containing protein [Heyndrickxia oleronia]|uniref:Multidrug ABC transporter permease/ATP-binding protein n=1 Tax=Heyndrickxia oleronia TaxID=38875 RepID=A0A8E2LGN9_9BACI|nr:ABC transporter transmembrane domain-containing protein [Heyndrickxia oleronia]NYV65814.1 ATP-binding cassette domain-containing protein [Bacillus sp. Gen3]OJH16477.1 multidrug ABC transporter permease/ATP-binding protein [Bacillus obstructivus]MBU5211252.1 ATP-binding cassette domain-containing protein [Heyndrickxia oleronia]MCM3456409.1 ABC transporter transmembrane domain-containing protein [Heyndrickxia oleronia]MEC1376687.1 ABC transporter transmembrane domain-containing protein [Heynd